MSLTIVPVPLNVGLNTVQPALLAEQGSLIDVLNYELTDSTGYKRIDGYERYDGFPDGYITGYSRVEMTANDPLEQALLVPNTIIYRQGTDIEPLAIGVIVGGPFDDTFYDVYPLRSEQSFVYNEQFLLYVDGESFVQLQSEDGLLRIIGEPDPLGDTFSALTPSGQSVDLFVTGTLQEGGILVTADEYLTNLRAYSEVLRGAVLPAPGAVAGLWWLDDRLLVAVNTLTASIIEPEIDPAPLVNRLYRWNGMIYRAARIEGTNNGVGEVEYQFILIPVRESTTVNDNLEEVTSADVFVKTWATDLSTTGNPNFDDNQYATLGYMNNHHISAVRGFTYLPASWSASYELGNHTSAFGPPKTFGEDDTYYLTGTDGTVMKVRLAYTAQSGGTFTGGDSVGRVEFVFVEQIAGDRDYPIDGDELHSEYPTTVNSRVLTLSSDGEANLLAGTGALDDYGTRYQWITANFYGNRAGRSAYGATGAGPAFWANTTGYGLLPTGVTADLDRPKYLSFHSGRLALGFEQGSVVLSVLGEPSNYNGEDGALEIATGDSITGLLDMPGETLAVFGQRSIRKITGTADANMVLGTISGNSGAFDYSAVLVGQEAVFTGVNGISALTQTAAYGDFAGQRMSDPIANWLRVKLANKSALTSKGNVVMAYPVRSKNQYRLVLTTGEVVILTLTSEGPRLTRANYAMTGQVLVPYAWSSATDTNGQERIHVAWTQLTRTSEVVEMEHGWGFNGQVFRHYFDTAHVFSNNGASFSKIEKVRLFGQGYGVATLGINSSGIEEDFDQPYHTRSQDISIPKFLESLQDTMRPVTSVANIANYGLGIKLRFEGTMLEGSNLTEPAHICQALVLHMKTEGARDG